MRRVKCVIAYDGTGFQGYQVQPVGRTVQAEIEKVLQKMHKGKFVRIHASGRTDAGVHAKGQVVHFDTPLFLETVAWKKALNAQLPHDIVVRNVEIVDTDFHARFSVIAKEYRYILYRSQERDPFLRNYAYYYPYSIDIQSMREGMNFILGEHDFTSFCSAKSEVEDRVRTIDQFTLTEQQDRLLFKIRGDGFLYNMVRILVGTMLEIGEGKKVPDDIPKIFSDRDRTLAGRTAPAHGLYLWEVFYS